MTSKKSHLLLEFKIYKRYEMFSNNKELLFFKNGFGIRFDSLNNKSVIYSYGPNKKDDNLSNISFNKLDSTGNIIDIKFSFLRFLNSYNSDIVIFELINNKNYFNKCNKFKNLKDLKNNLGLGTNNPFVLSFNLKFLSTQKEIKFKKNILKLNFLINKREFTKKDYEEGKTKTVFFRYQNNKISIVCDNNIPKELLEKHSLEIKQYFLTMDKSYFDYAVFPITFVEDIYKPLSR